MRYLRTAFEVEVELYEVGKGIEDGFELWTDIVTQGYINTDTLIKIKREDGTIVCPYISTRRGMSFLEEGDYVITEKDGLRHVCGPGSLLSRYEPLE